MAKHESEMHRQNRIMRDALEAIAREGGTAWPHLAKYASDTLAIVSKCEIGLFGDHSQMDLQDRKDLTTATK